MSMQNLATVAVGDAQSADSRVGADGVHLQQFAVHYEFPVVFTHALESTIGARHVLHCAAAFAMRGGVHGLRTDGLFTLDVAEPVCCDRGWVAVPDGPGLGIEL